MLNSIDQEVAAYLQALIAHAHLGSPARIVDAPRFRTVPIKRLMAEIRFAFLKPVTCDSIYIAKSGIWDDCSSEREYCDP
jgi:hypothetical protein